MIYFAQPSDGGRIKIGTTIRLSQRLKQLAAEHGCDLHVLAVQDGGPDDEVLLHRRFAHLRAVGEWFEPGDDLVGFIMAEGRPWDGSDDTDTKPVRLDLGLDDHERIERSARRLGLSKSAYVRMALFERLEADESKQ
jgi:hypothetical protein